MGFVTLAGFFALLICTTLPTATRAVSNEMSSRTRFGCGTAVNSIHQRTPTSGLSIDMLFKYLRP
jgi:hypothetical protein